jgi:TrmH family RNA methyltransferase
MEIPNAEAVTVNRAVFEKLSYRENPDGWLAVFQTPERTLESLKPGPVPLVLVAESVEKPGNLGAILRTADAAGVDALLICDPRVDLWNPNVVRASRGALFSVPAVDVDNGSALGWLRSRGMQILAATPSAETLYTSADMTAPLAIAVGTEDVGLSEFWLSNAHKQVRIPLVGKVNSLNVSIAAALLVYEAVRQRS